MEGFSVVLQFEVNRLLNSALVCIGCACDDVVVCTCMSVNDNILKGWGGFRMFVRCFRIILSRLNSLCSFSRDSITEKQSYIFCCLIPANGIKS